MGPSLVIMAAGMGSRYGGLKQIDAFGPNKETILEYSIYDAIRAGFSEVVLVIRESLHDDFIRVFANTFQDKITVKYVYQEINPQVDGYDLPIRKKPWGTGHAVLSAKDAVSGPFCVINADDWYGFDAFTKMYTYLTNDVSNTRCGMVGYILNNTLSPHGTVNRGVCKVDNGSLMGIQEHLKISYRNDSLQDAAGNLLNKDSIVSMNFRGFDLAMFDVFEKEFRAFLDIHKDEESAEFFITTPPNTFIHEEGKVCDVLISKDNWYGVTYADDKPFVQQAITTLIDTGVYPSNLWG